MKSNISLRTAAFHLLIVCACSGWSQTPAILTSLNQIHALSNQQARSAPPVAFEATVTDVRVYERMMFVQDGDIAIFVYTPANIKVAPGDRILVRGTAQDSFNPIVVASSITLIRHVGLPAPVRATFDGLIHLQYDCRFVTVHAVIRAADMVSSSASTPSMRSIRLQLVMDGGHIEAAVGSDDQSALDDLLGAEVEVTGAASGVFDDKMQLIGLSIFVPSLAQVKILKRATASPWSLPVTPLDEVLHASHVNDLSQRVRVHGTITFYEPGSAIVLQDGTKSLWINTHTREALQIGDVADATGFPDAHNFLSTLMDSEVKDSHVQAPIPPLPATWRELAYWNLNRPVGHQFDLVSIEGQVVKEVREAARDEFVLSSNGQLFSAIYRHPPFSTSQRSPVMDIPTGTTIRVTGICTVVDPDPSNKGQEAPFDIRLRSLDDIAVVARPSWLNTRNLTRMVILLLLAMIIVAIWGLLLMRKVHRQTSAMAARTEAEASLERRRSRILEDINGSRPLAEIVEEIAEMVSFKLNGAPCCCQIADGARLGAFPPETARHRIVRMEIRGHSGPLLGEFVAGLDPHSQPARDETEALSVGAGLAALAIESRRLYSDLLHRSEFDQLTEVHNRFSLDKRLEAQIEEARLKASIFGLIYIDLDKFKQINDLHGHNVGDLYLQEVALRMKGQLRAVDLLARLGGDEFAVLVPVVRNRMDVEEIAQRLERCFENPFAVEGLTLHGSASVGFALYPEGGDTKDSLLNAADAAMYAVKNSRQQVGKKA